MHRFSKSSSVQFRRNNSWHFSLTAEYPARLDVHLQLFVPRECTNEIWNKRKTVPWVIKKILQGTYTFKLFCNLCFYKTILQNYLPGLSKRLQTLFIDIHHLKIIVGWSSQSAGIFSCPYIFSRKISNWNFSSQTQRFKIYNHVQNILILNEKMYDNFMTVSAFTSQQFLRY